MQVKHFHYCTSIAYQLVLKNKKQTIHTKVRKNKNSKEIVSGRYYMLLPVFLRVYAYDDDCVHGPL